MRVCKKKFFQKEFGTLSFLLAFFFVGPVAGGITSYDFVGILDKPHPFVTRAERPIVSSINPLSPFPHVNFPKKNITNKKQFKKFAVASGKSETLKRAASENSNKPNPTSQSFLTLAAGYFDINDNEDAAEFRLEWRGRRFFEKMSPLLGLMGSSDGAIYGYSGMAYDIFFNSNLFFTPSFSLGAYADGDGKNLGSTIEFRSAVELSYRFKDHSRIGVMFYHLSNAGIRDKNPGTEILSFGYTIPFN